MKSFLFGLGPAPCPLLPSPKALLPVGSLGGVAGSWPDGWPQGPACPARGHLSICQLPVASWQREMAREEARGGPAPWGGR